MTTRGWTTWTHSSAVRYLLVGEDEEGAPLLWGRAAGAEGFFVEPAPLPREVLVFEGCDPRGVLRDVTPQTVSPFRDFGNLVVQVSDDTGPRRWGYLEDVVVFGCRPAEGATELVDIVVGAGVVPFDESRDSLAGEPRFELLGARDESAGVCQAVDGLYDRVREWPRKPVTLVGCELTVSPEVFARGGALWLWTLDDAGRCMNKRCVSTEIVLTGSSIPGHGLADVTVADCFDPLPRPSMRPIWESWRGGVPRVPNSWAAYTTEGRTAWLSLMNPDPDVKDPHQGGAYDVDGRYATDAPGLHCAISEGIAGPGGYFGREWNALADCLAGGFGADPPFTLVWHDADVARNAFADGRNGSTGRSYFDEVIELFRSRGATVVLE